VPESRGRKKKKSNSYRPNPGVQVAQPIQDQSNPAWLLPVMLGLMILGLAWIVVYYLTAGSYRLPIPGLGNWNLVIGFASILAGFALTTRWR